MLTHPSRSANAVAGELIHNTMGIRDDIDRRIRNPRKLQVGRKELMADSQEMWRAPKRWSHIRPRAKQNLDRCLVRCNYKNSIIQYTI